MFARQGFVSPFQLQQFAGGLTPFAPGVGFGGINPLLSQLSSPFAGPIAGLSPIGTQVNPWLTPQIGAGIAPVINPFGQFNPLINQTVNPLLALQLASQLSPYLTPQAVSGYGGVSPYGIQSAGINPLSQLLPQQLWQQPFQPGLAAHSFGLTGDPLSAALVAQQQLHSPAYQQQFNPLAQQQQFNPLAQSQLPIRPLVSPQWQDIGQTTSPFQAAFPFSSTHPGFTGGTTGITGSPFGQLPDPSTVFAQSPLASQFGASPIQHLLRACGGNPWAAGGFSPFATQGFPTPQAGVPFGCF